MQFLCGFQVGGISIFDTDECSEMIPFTSSANSGYPFIAFEVPFDAAVAATSIVPVISVHAVLGMIGSSEIAPTIVEWIFVDVIDLFDRPSACHVQPSELVAAINFASEADGSAGTVPVFCCGTSDAIDTTSWASLDPGELASVWIVVEDLAYACGGRYVSGSHALLPYGRGWSGAASGDRPLVAPLG